MQINQSNSKADSETSASQGGRPGLPLVGHSGLGWNSGQWVNGGSDRMQQYMSLVGREPDAVTQSLRGMQTWAQHAGANSEAEVDRDFLRSPEDWWVKPPVINGVFKNLGWARHIWGSKFRPYRERIIHLAWMDSIPQSHSNGWTGSDYRNPTLWRDIKNGLADKYMFLLGRKFAYLDERTGDTKYPMTIDLTYEWTLAKHSPIPEGSYEIDGVKHYTYEDFPYGWARMVRAFEEGYQYQRGRASPYNFSWRPQMRFLTRDRREGGEVVHHEVVFPNTIADWTIPAPVEIDGIQVLPAGKIGKTADLVGVSWHDSSFEKVRGSSETADGNNWQEILNGNGGYWGLNELADFARQEKIGMIFPEWSARRDKHPPASPFPGDVYRLTFDFFNSNKDVLAYETTFDQGSGSLYVPWSPTPAPGQDPIAIYQELWGK